jgi:hypothetical protein
MKGSYNGWNIGILKRTEERKERSKGIMTDGIWRGSYNGWNIEKKQKTARE